MTTPGDKLTEFSARWNDLRNAVLGRGTQLPAGVSPDLADRVGNTYARWRKYLAQMPAPMALLPTAAIADWVRQYRALVNEARAAGLRFRVYPEGGLAEELVSPKRRGGQEDGGGRRLAVYAALIALPLLLCVFSGRRRA
jgi:hypothetical protein